MGAGKDEKGKFIEGNKMWEFRNKHGNDYKYTPDELWAVAIEYFRWVEDNPLWESIVVSRGIVVNKGTEGEKTIYSTAVPKMRAMTIKGLTLYVGICEKTFANYRNNPDFVQVITRIENCITEQKFTGAAANLLNPNIIARDLGLVDKTEQEHKFNPKDIKGITFDD